MKRLILNVCLCSLVFVSSSLFAEGKEIKDNSTGISFPSEVSFDSNGKTYQLQATGVATRKKFFVKVYSVASYLQDATAKTANIAEEILNPNKAKQLTMKWVREAPINKVQEGYIESFQNSLQPQAFNSLQNDINTFVLYFNQPVKAGDEHVLRWIPTDTIEVIINGKKVGEIKNEQFAKSLWTIWFGPRSVVNKDALLSLVQN
jgi:hypothetical protein